MLEYRSPVFTLTLIVAGLVLSALPGSLSTARAAQAKDFSVCQKLINKSSQSLFKGMLGAKLKCAEALVACKVGEETGGGSFASCSAKQALKCSKKISKALDKFPAKIVKVLAKKQCLALTHTQIKARVSGLGFRDAEQFCASLTPPESIIGKNALGDCLAGAAICRSDDTLEALIPRAYEALDAAGLVTSLPAGSFRCLDVRVPSAASAGAPAKDLARCQRAYRTNGFKTAKTMPKALYRCADAFLECAVGEERGEIDAVAAVGCNTDAGSDCDKRLGQLTSQQSDREIRIDDACATVATADLLSGLGFSLDCTAATTPAEVRACSLIVADAAVAGSIASAEPRTCALLGDNGRLTGLEDACLPFCGNGILEAGESCDDGNRDPLDVCTNQCVLGPTDFALVNIPSAAAPANTPDGTPANAVPGGSTLETRFGSTIFSLNNSTYVRFFAPGAGDADVVLVMIPGFAAGAQTFKTFAEIMIDKAASEASMVLEVWAVDRRTNQLEDLSGVIQAENDLDPRLGLDWFFGGEVGFTLDSRLSRRAVFHAGADVAFIANFTPNVFARDIDAVVDAATASPGAPTVFLGGHSLGTTFTGRYAATDFDTGAGVTAGYTKVAGLVLMEGGVLFGSAASTTPTDDELDAIIARADGGLYNAVLTGAPSCVDGTPCTSNADCSAVTPPVGAITSVCVDPVEAYTGADTSGTPLLTPQIQAAGDVIAIQGRVDPDSQAIVQVDQGSGSAVSLVPGLALLDLLTTGTAEAALGIFLDDDFSPQPAFRVSTGFTNNGNNISAFGFDFLIAGTSSFDPLRYWINAGEPLPSAAVPDNGPPLFFPDRVNGVEVEVTPIETMFSLIHAGESNFGDWYFASSGLGVTTELGGLDSTPLSVTRGRPDIENLTQVGNIDIPVIAFGGTNGLAPTNGSFKDFAQALGACTAPSCTGASRVVNPLNVQTVYGGPDGGFEAHLSEGYAHIDVVTAPDDPAHNNVYDPLLAFLLRNAP